MAIYDGNQAIKESLLDVAKFAAMAALKAPKMPTTKIKTKILTGEDVLPLAEILGVLGESSAFLDGDSVCGMKAYEESNPIAILLIGTDTTKSDLNYNCGACGFKTCAEFNRFSTQNGSAGFFFSGPSCNWKVFDFGMAVSWAAATVAYHNVDSRVHTSYGSVGRMLGHLDDCNIVLGVTLAAGRDEFWYSRSSLKGSFTLEDHESFVTRTLPQLCTGFVGSGYPPHKHNNDWLRDPKFLKLQTDEEWNAQQEDIGKRVAEILEREKAKKTKEEG